MVSSVNFQYVIYQDYYRNIWREYSIKHLNIQLLYSVEVYE